MQPKPISISRIKILEELYDSTAPMRWEIAFEVLELHPRYSMMIFYFKTRQSSKAKALIYFWLLLSALFLREAAHA